MPVKKPRRPYPDREVILVRNLDDVTLEAIAKARIPEEARQLDYLMSASAID